MAKAVILSNSGSPLWTDFFDAMMCLGRWLSEFWSEHPGGDSAEEGPEGQHEESWLFRPEC